MDNIKNSIKIDPFKTVLKPGTIVKKNGKYGVVDPKGNIQYSGLLIVSPRIDVIASRIGTRTGNKPIKSHKLSIEDKLELR